MANNTVTDILKCIGSGALIGGSIWLTIAHGKAFTINQYFYGYAVWGISIIFSHYHVLQNSKSLFAAIVRYTALALLSIPIVLFIFELLRLFSPYHSLKDIISRAPIYGYIEIALYTCCLISGLIFILKKRGQSYNPIYRIFFYYIFHITLIYCVAIRAFWCYELFLKPKEVVWPIRLEPIEHISIYTKGSYQSMIAITAGYFLNKFYKEKQAIFKVPKSKRYALYLRAFKDDTKTPFDNCLSEFYKSKNLEIIQVADPSKVSYNKSFQGKNLFILSPEWKKELSYCIEHAEHITLCIGSSKGVQWEMYSNLQHLDKYLFYVPEKAALLELINQTNQDYANTPVAEATKELYQLNLTTFYFVIRDNKCYYSDDFETLINRDCLDGVLYINLQIRHQSTSIQKKTNKKSTMDIFSRISLKHLSIPIIALGPLLILGLQANLSSNPFLSKSRGFLVFIVIIYVISVIVSIKLINETDK